MSNHSIHAAAHVTIGAGAEIQNALADRSHRYLLWTRERVAREAQLIETRAHLEDVTGAEMKLRSERVALTSKVQELEAAVAAADAGIAGNMPPPATPVAARAAPLPVESQASADVVARANGYKDGAAHDRVRYLATLTPDARVAMEASPEHLDRALALVAKGNIPEALAIASVLLMTSIVELPEPTKNETSADATPVVLVLATPKKKA